MNFEQLSNDVLTWANEKRIIKPENHLKQMGKMMAEVGELADEIIKGQDKQALQSEFGDVLVTLIILAEQLDINPTKCLEMAYNKIKDRKGQTIGGTFIKEYELK